LLRKLNSYELGERHGFDLLRKDGLKINTKMHISPFSNDDGESIRYVLIVNDITKIKRLEDTLRELESRYLALAEQIRDAIVIIQDGVIKYCNDADIRLSGYTQEEILRLPFIDFMARQDINAVSQAYEARISGKKEDNPVYETQIYCKDGTIKQIEISASLIQYQGRPAIMGIAYDITRRRQAEELFNALSVSSPIGIYIVQDRKIKLGNPQFQIFTGYSEDELANMNPLVLVFHEDRDLVRENAVNMLKGKRSAPYEYRVVGKDGSLSWIMETVTSITYKGRQAALGHFINITEQKEAKKRLDEFSQKLK
jgi:PAS domain S-box-containing protein